MSGNSEYVPAVERTLRILSLLANAQRPLSCSEISLRLKIPRTSTHMIVKTLEAHKYLRKASRHGYQLGAALLAFGRSNSGMELAEQVIPRLRELAARTRLPVRFAVLESAGAVVIAGVDATGATTPDAVPGHLDLWTSPLGRSLLAGLSEPEVVQLARLAPSHDNPSVVESAIGELQKLRNSGFIAGEEPAAFAAVTVAAPVLLRETAVAAIGVTGPARELRGARLEYVGNETARTAAQLAADPGPFLPAVFQRISATGVP